MENSLLIEKALEAKKRSYSPYSKFKVGAAVIMENGEVYTGTNIENAAYSPTICAERVAIFKGVYEGNRKIKKLVVTGDTKYTYPCGVCRQVISEFANGNTLIIIANSVENYKTYKFEEILPYGFSNKDLNK